MAVTPFKAVVPEDYTYLLVDTRLKNAFDGSTTSSGILSATNPIVLVDATSIDETYFEGIPSYYIVGEYSYTFLAASKTISTIMVGETGFRELTCKINVGDAVDSHYRYIRFIIKPNLTITNNITTALHIFLNFSVVMDSIVHSFSKRLTAFKIPQGASLNIKTMAFVYDTQTGTIMDYTDAGTDLWSSL